ncbi:MAG: hypothetical protein KKG04_01720, partial [Candidatus Thermoplasmatota archaeon]|nr:hypothetical protein [Candidatus Thermoplasmatota archaeon]
FLPQLYIVSLVFFRDLKLKSFPMLLFIAILILTLSTIIYNVEAAWTNHLWVSQEMAQLKDIESFENVSSINLLNHQKDLWWDNLWEHNFLLKKNIYNEIPTYYPKSILKGEWFLINNMSENVSFYHIFNNSLVFDGILKYELPLNNSCFINSEYTMVKPSYSFSVSLGDGWHAQEPTHCWTSSKNSTVLIFSSEDKQVNMSVQVIPFDNDNMLSVYVNDKLVQNFTDNMNFSLSLSLKSGENTIFFKSFLPPQQPGINDKRYIGYAFRQIKLLARL